MKQSHTRASWFKTYLQKITCVLPENEIEEHFMKFIPDTQCGCARGRGKCLAGQIVELAADFSKGREKCWGRLYLDPSATFDSILREFIVADTTYDMARMRSELKALSICDEVCEQIISDAVTTRWSQFAAGRPDRRHLHSHLDCVLERDAEQ